MAPCDVPKNHMIRKRLYNDIGWRYVFCYLVLRFIQHKRQSVLTQAPNRIKWRCLSLRNSRRKKRTPEKGREEQTPLRRNGQRRTCGSPATCRSSREDPGTSCHSLSAECGGQRWGHPELALTLRRLHPARGNEPGSQFTWKMGQTVNFLRHILT